MEDSTVLTDSPTIGDGRLASIIENNTTNETKKIYIEKYLCDVKKQDVKNIILGCTHYPLVKEEIQKYLNNQKPKVMPVRKLSIFK